ncbi:MAG: hypothetical protein C0485_18615 [Pirellula sp.]|nr:hypothetical protein [Pirellula sp.]
MSNLIRDNSDGATGVRFRLPALLAAMSLLALLAALAGPYFRQQSTLAQGSLSAYWGMAAMAAIASWAWRWRRMTTPPPQMGAVHWRVTLVWGRAWPGPTIRLSILAAAAMWLVFGTGHIVGAANRFPDGFSSPWTLAIINGTVMGFTLGGAMLPLLPKQPAFVCDRGVWSVHRQTVWNKLKAWQRRSDKPGVMQLTEVHSTRLHGHLFLAVPTKRRAAIEAFVREKTELTIPDPQARVTVVDEAEDEEGAAI